MTRRIPKEHEDAMIEAYLNGATLEQAAAPFGYDKTTCSKILKRHGIAVRSRRMPQEHEDAMIEAYLKGATLEQAAALFGYDAATCSNVLKRRGITKRTLSEAKQMPQEHEEGMIAAYLAGASAEKAAAQFGYTGEACFNALKRRGITPRSHAEVCRIPPEHEEAVVEAYLAGATQREAAALFGYSGDACLNALKRRGITPRNQKEVCSRYAVDETFFDDINSEEKAYWLGFLTADGGIANSRIMLALKASDAGHLHKFVTSLHSEHPIKVVNQKGYSSEPGAVAKVTIFSIRLVQALSLLGVDERKSFTVRPCERIPPALLSAYWRGVFDGDGTIHYFRSNPSLWRVSLCGNIHIVTGFRDFMSMFVNSKAKIFPQSSIFQIQYGGTALPQAVARVLYDKATIYLDRKYALAKQLCKDLS